MIKKFNLIACCDLNNGIGQNRDLPWHLPNEYKYFQFLTQRVDNNLNFLEQYKIKFQDSNNNLTNRENGENNETNPICVIQDANQIDEKSIEMSIKNSEDYENKNSKAKTKQEILFNEEDKSLDQIDFNSKFYNCLIMGSNTWNSLPETYRPLKNRLNLVISKNKDAKSLNISSNHLFKSLEDALIYASKQKFIKCIFVVGGEQVYNQAIEMNECNKIYLTKINFRFNCDRFFPSIDKQKFKEIDEFGLKDVLQIENNLEYKFTIYERIKRPL